MADLTPLIGKEAENLSRGHFIFGCCCDSKRGTIVVNVISIIVTAIAMSLMGVAYNDPNFETKTMDKETMHRVNNNYLPAMVMYGVSILISFVVIFGASFYSTFVVLLGAIWTTVRLTLTLLLTVPPVEDTDRKDLQILYIAWPIAWGLIMLYPQVVFVLEVKNGIMSPRSYHFREKHSCCCDV